MGCLFGSKVFLYKLNNNRNGRIGLSAVWREIGPNGFFACSRKEEVQSYFECFSYSSSYIRVQLDIFSRYRCRGHMFCCFVPLNSFFFFFRFLMRTDKADPFSNESGLQIIDTYAISTHNVCTMFDTLCI